MPTSIRLDLVHTSPVVTTALRHELRRGERPLRVTTAVHSWVHFQEEWDFTGPFVVLDALLDLVALGTVADVVKLDANNRRLVAQGLGERLGQPVVVENRPGAGATTGSALVAAATPDGG